MEKAVINFEYFKGSKKELENDKFYYYKFFLDTPYKWGPGYGEATPEERHMNDTAIRQACETLDFFVKKGNSCCADIYYSINSIEEIYAHPMELSGVLSGKHILQLYDFLCEATRTKDPLFEHTTLYELRIFDEVKEYTANDVYEISQRLVQDINTLKKKYPFGVALNYNFEDYPDLKFHDYLSANGPASRQKQYKDYLISLVNYNIRKEVK